MKKNDFYEEFEDETENLLEGNLNDEQDLLWDQIASSKTRITKLLMLEIKQLLQIRDNIIIELEKKLENDHGYYI